VSEDAGAAAPPRITVGVPVFNGERYLTAAIESILNQTRGDFELIVADNASTDSTPEIVRRFAARDPRIRAIRQPANVGVARNFNAIVHAARGEFFKFASANDEYAPTLLAECAAVLEGDPGAVLCFGAVRFIDEHGRRTESYRESVVADMPDPLARYDSVRGRLGLSTPLQCGLLRTAALRLCGDMGSFRDSDVVVTAGLALLGRLARLPQVHMYRRLGREVASSNRSALEIQRMFDPGVARVPAFVNLRAQLAHLAMLLRLPLGFGTRMRGLARALRYVAWDRAEIFAEMRRAIARRPAG
jgi:glycosyltransferase involved in cell wall biosynthesis